MPPPASSIPAECSETVIARILNECQHSHGAHTRRAVELLKWRSAHRDGFLADLWKCLLPIFTVLRREPAVERVVKFVVTFVTLRNETHGPDCDAFLEEFFGLLLFSVDAANKAVRLRACQILSEVILKLHEEAEVSDEVWDNVVKSMCMHMQDKIPAVRVYSARALARFASADESEEIDCDGIISTYRRSLKSDQNAEVRKNIILSIPACNATVNDIVEHTADVSEAVRRTSFFVLSRKFPIQSLSIKQRTTVLQRGLHDRVDAVKTECMKMLRDTWLVKCCQGEPISLLKYLDVETNESVGESVMLALLSGDAIKIKDDECGLSKFLTEANGEAVNLMEPEEALYWRVCIGYLHSEIQAKGHDAAVTGGTQATLNAAVAGEKNELLDRILPTTMAEYISIVQAHIAAGIHFHFASRQLLLIGKFLDYSDATSRKVAGTFLQNIICSPAGHFDNDVIIGDGVSLGGDKNWAAAIAELAWKVFVTSEELVRVISDVVAELGRPCREGGPSIMQWVNCLAATGFLLENTESLHQLNGHAIEPHELLGGILLPAAKHMHPEVRTSAIRCLGLFCLRERKPSLQAVKQLRLALKATPVVKRMASKAFFDLCMWHSAGVLDRLIGLPPCEGGTDDDGLCELPILEELAKSLDGDGGEQESSIEEENGHIETLQSVVAEGFAKLMLQSKVFPDVLPMQHIIFGKLVRLYFDEETKSMPSLRQCLAVFFETYPSISIDHKRCISRALVPVLRSEWPGIHGNAIGPPAAVSAKKKHATKLLKFMLQMLCQPLFGKENSVSERPEGMGDSGHEGCTSPKRSSGLFFSLNDELAVRMAAEVAGFPSPKSAVARSYLSMLIKTMGSLELRQPEQQLIKCTRMLLDKAKESIAGDRLATKDLDNLMTRLSTLDATASEDLSEEELHKILCNMELEDLRLSQVEQESSEMKSPEPASAPVTATKSRGGRRRRGRKSCSPDCSTPSPGPSAVGKTPATRTTIQRASKTAAMERMRPGAEFAGKADRRSPEESMSGSSSSDFEQEEGENGI